jgi:5,10-methylenetetrahydromethanopterin reductase
VPTIVTAAETADRPAPRIVASLPIVVTDDPTGAKEFVASSLQLYGTLPSYRAMLDREGVADPSDIAIVGSEDQAAAAFEQLRDAGITDFGAAEMGRNPDEVARTREFLRTQI